MLIACAGISIYLAVLMKQARDEANATLALLKDALLERGFLVAFTGDVEQVQQILQHSKQVGLTDEWQSTLLGAAYLFRGDLEKSIAALEEAAVDEENCSALALLGAAYLQAYEYSKYEQLYPKIVQAQPRPAYRDYDEFLLTHGRGQHDFSKTADLMESVLQRRPSWVLPRALVEDCRTVASQQTGEWMQLQAVLDKFDSLATLFPDNLFVARYRLGALVAAVEHHRRRDLPLSAELQAKAFEAVKRLRTIGSLIVYDHIY